MDSIDNYILKMSQSGTYADHIVIQSCSKVLKRTIHIVEEGGDHMIGEYDDTVLLGYLPDMEHYVSITDSSNVKAVNIEIEKYYAVD